MSVIYDSTKGRPNACASMVLRRLSAYTRRDRVKQFKIGMTNDPERRFRTAYARNYHEMVVLYETSSIDNVSVLEAELVEHNKDHADNVIAGGGGAVGEPPYFLYVVLKYKITKLLGWELARVQRKFKTLFQSFGLGCLAFLLNSSEPVSAAGVTIVTHGYQISAGHPAWLDAMGNAIAARAGTSTLVYNLNMSLSDTTFNFETGPASLATSTNAEIVIKVYWDEWANPCNFNVPVTTASIAASVFPYLTNSITPANGGPRIARPLVEMPLHFIGHSRGGSVILEIAHLLAEHGVWVDQVTTLDPHPLTRLDLNALCGILNFSVQPDPDVQLYDNVVFADEYYQFDNDGFIPISGVPVNGAAEQFLNDRFASDGLPEAIANDHSEVHDWYHGTIDTNATAVAGDPIPRATWYVPSDIGFRFALMAHGQAFRKQIESSYIGEGLKWNGATRSSAYIRTNLQWPDIELENAADLWTVLQGTNVPILLRFQNSFSNYMVTVDFGLDDDRNPYNNAATNIIGTFNYAIDSSSWTNVLFSLSPTITVSGRYLYGRITDYKGYVRYFYLSRPFYVLSSLPQFHSSIRLPDGVFQANLATQAGVNYAIQASTDLSNWSTLTTVQATNTTLQFTDQQAINFPRRLYRAIAF